MTRMELLKTTLAGLRLTTPLNEELLEQVTEQELAQMRLLLTSASDAKLQDFALRLNRKNTAVCVALLGEPQSEANIEKLNRILSVRNGRTVRRLLWVALQRMPHSVPVQSLLVKLNQENREGLLDISRLEHRLDGIADPILLALQQFYVNKKMFSIYLISQGILRDTAFTRHLRFGFFTTCKRELYADHGNELYLCLDDEVGDRQLQVLAHFLQVHQMNNFPYKITHTLIQRFGIPGESDTWRQAANLPENPAKLGLLELTRWWYLQRMAVFFGHMNRKYYMLSRYVEYLQNVVEDETHQVIRLYFKDFVLVDFKQVERCSWICDPITLEMQYEMSLDRMRTQAATQTKRSAGFGIPDARNVILEKENATIVQLNYVEVGVLYTADLLDIRLGIKDEELDF